MKGSRSFKLHDGKGGCALAVRVSPRSSRNEIAEVLEDGTVKIRLTSPPLDGKANQGLVDFLSGILNVPPSDIEIVAGLTGRNKLVSVLNMDAGTMEKKIEEYLSKKK